MNDNFQENLCIIDFIATEDSNIKYKVFIVDPNSEFGTIGEKLKELNIIKSERGHHYSFANEEEIYIFIGNDVISDDEDLKGQEAQEDVLSAIEKGNDNLYINKALITTIIDACNSLLTTSFAIELKSHHIPRFVSLINHYNYQFNDFKAKRSFKLKQIDIITDNVDYTDQILRQSEVISICNNYANYLSDLPANICTTSFLAEEVSNLAKLHPSCDFEILDESNLKSLGMNCLLAVGSGSPQHTYLASLSFKNSTQYSDKKIVLIGKGIIYDTGGLNLKLSNSMLDAHKDMQGAATVLGVMRAAILLNLPINLMIILAIAENSCDGLSMRQGDIIRSMSGKTVKINHTDAEGRLALCDTITYAQRSHDAALIITVATLTGSVLHALGRECYALFTNSGTLREKLLISAVKAEESCWPLPMYSGYSKHLDDSRADIVNVNLKMEAGSIQGAVFLNTFVESKCEFAHFDIAGAWSVSNPKFPIGTIINFLRL
jgi:leucyl aminopeptidase